MRELWVRIEGKTNKKHNENLLELAAKTCDAVYVDEDLIAAAKKAGAKTASNTENSDIFILEDFNPQKFDELKRKGKTVAVRITIREKEDEEKAIRAAALAPDYIVVNCINWKIIPLENLIATTRGKTKILAEVLSSEEAKTALETLELGADGVILKTSDLNEIMKAATVAKTQSFKIKLDSLQVIDVKPIGTGARVCVDTSEIMRKGEGLLLGCQSACLFLVEAEVHETPFVTPRPFRVNAGPVSLYVLSSINKTKYLSELRAGDEILIVERTGNVRQTNVVRVKIEWRPMMLVEAEYEGKMFKIILQNAETIRLVSQEGSIPVTELKKGQRVLAYITEGGRHFGTLVKEETVIEL
ncbi:MAG: 3-dehydroquinate synthase II [Candidatus Bathyarchaeia archaeon]